MTTPHDEAFLEAAASLGRRLCRDALWAGDRCNWLGDAVEPVGGAMRVVHRALGPDLYGGTSGVALFLAVLHRLTGEAPFRVTAEGAIAQALSRAEDIPPAARIAFYSGWTGIAYVLATVGAAFERMELVERAYALIASAARTAGPEVEFDVMVGAAGAIPALISLQSHERPDDLIALATRLGEHLVANARKSDVGWSWKTLEGQTERDATGFSHGAAGIAWSLLELFAATGSDRFREGAECGFAYERQWLNKANENWPDFRLMPSASSDSGTLGYSAAWCHGAPGIGLSRLRAYELLGGEVMRQEAEMAIRTTTRSLNSEAGLRQGDFCLCHGRGGNAELLIYAADALGDDAARAGAEAVGRQGIEIFGRKNLPWPCGVPDGGETPNLMLGLAGIGYFYLRLYDPANVPSVLIIRPPDDRRWTD
ncbi:MAG: hypothetical protein JO001_18685 [Alphaproteobacteria bacterium]|nr:hypothetical protein [Alphaproteobacteria bacterium]